MYADFYLKHLQKTKIRNGEVIGLCPFHAESNPSFYANIKTGVFYCHGCNEKGNTFSFAEKLGIQLTEIPDCQKNNNQKRKIVTEYNYHDEKGNLLYQVVRFEPKDFRQRRPDGMAVGFGI